MEIGTHVTAEIIANGKPEKITGSVTASNRGMLTIQPDGFHRVTIEVPESNVYAVRPEAIQKPQLQYSKKHR